ncbi:MAG TPA: peptide chain release factor N(5)-glutamine methyltransferase [Chroococcales cyanobacterium]
MPTLRQLKKSIFKRLTDFAIEESEAECESEMIAEHVTGYNTAAQFLHAGDAVKDSVIAAVELILSKRRERLPIQYCLGSAWFMGLELDVCPGVFIPRSDTESVVTTALAQLQRDPSKQHRLAEIGIGSGAISIGILKNAPNVRIEACDMSATAVQVSSSNAVKHNVNDRLLIQLGDWQQLLPSSLDGIVSNPPYIPASEREKLQPEVGWHEPELALFGSDDDGMGFYRALAARAKAHLTEPEGFVVVEVGDGQADNVAQIFVDNRWADVRIVLDMNGLPRTISAIRS